MKKKIIAIGIVAALAIGVLAPVAPATYASAEICNSANIDKNSETYKSLCGGTKTEADAENVVKSILGTVFTWTGIVSVIVIIIGGIFYMLSQGDPGKVARAKNTILYAVIGLIVSLLAFAIVNFVLTAVGAA